LRDLPSSFARQEERQKDKFSSKSHLLEREKEEIGEKERGKRRCRKGRCSIFSSHWRKKRKGRGESME